MIELRLVHDGRHWIARGESWSATGRTLPDLDRAVAEIVREREDPGRGRSVQVRMNFDCSVIPEWIRQYSNHYFNRMLTVDGAREISRDSLAEGKGPCQPM